MGDIYTIAEDNRTITNAGGDVDLIEVLTADDKPCALLGWKIGVHSEEADANDELLRLTLQRGHTTSGSGGASNTPRPVDGRAPAFGGTVEVGNTTIASAGTSVILDADMVQNKIPNLFGPIPHGFDYTVRGTELLVVRLMEAPADDIIVNFTFWIMEL